MPEQDGPNQPEFDAAAWVRDLDRLSKEAKNRRPARGTIRTGILEVCEAMSAEPMLVHAGSPGATDMAAPGGELTAQTLTELLDGCWISAIEHFAGLGSLYVDPAIALPQLTLTRAVVEAAAACHHLVDDVPYAERQARVFNARLSQLVRAFRQAEVEAPDSVDQREAAVTSLSTEAASLGLSVTTWDPSNPRSMPTIGASTSTTAKIGRMFDEMAFGRYVYGDLSAVAHSESSPADLEWFTMNRGLLGGGLPDWDIARRCMPAALAIWTTAEHIQAYLGVPMEATVERATRLCVLWETATR